MPNDTIPFSGTREGQGHVSAPALIGEKLLIDTADLAYLTSLGVRTLRRMDSAGDIPGRVVCGRRVLFQKEIIRKWVQAGLPDKNNWAKVQEQPGACRR
jgi:hypothetical protein